MEHFVGSDYGSYLFDKFNKISFFFGNDGRVRGNARDGEELVASSDLVNIGGINNVQHGNVHFFHIIYVFILSHCLFFVNTDSVKYVRIMCDSIVHICHIFLSLFNRLNKKAP